MGESHECDWGKSYGAEIELVVIVCSILLSKYISLALYAEKHWLENFFFFNKETLNEFFRLQGQYTISVAHSSF